MKVRVIRSGSLGNSYILTSESGSQIILECGVKIDLISANVNYKEVCCCLYSHNHTDHILSKSKLELFGIDCLGTENLENGEIFTCGEWNILPIQVPHGNTKCFAYIIVNNAENKKLLFCTDLERIPNIADTHFDLMMLETNYSEDFTFKAISAMAHFNKACFTHLSLEKMCSWLSQRQHLPSKLLLIHLSNSGLITRQLITQKLQNCKIDYEIAQAGLELEV